MRLFLHARTIPKHWRGLVSLIALLGLVTQTIAQDIRDDNFIRCTRQEGLSNNYITGLVQDSAGYLWVATQKGLNRFDGKVFTNIFRSTAYSPLPDNLLVTLRAAGKNRMMGVTAAGAFWYDPVRYKAAQFIIPSDTGIYFWTNYGYDIGQDKLGHYIVSTKTGMYVFKEDGQLLKRYDHFLPAQAGAEELMFGSWVHTLANGKVMQQNDLGATLYDPATNSIDTLFAKKSLLWKQWFLDSAGVERDLYSGKRDELFVVNYKRNGIEVVDWQTGKSQFNAMPFPMRAEVDSGFRVYYINDTLLAIPGKISGFYLLEYDARNRKLVCKGDKLFKGRLCTVLLNDRDGRLWVGTNDGLYKQNFRSTFFKDADLAQQYPAVMNHDIASVYADDKLIYVGLRNEGGLLLLDKNTKKTVKHIDFTGISNTLHDILAYDKDTLWIGTSKGLVWFNKKNYRYGRIVVPGNGDWANSIHTHYFLEDGRGNIWIAFGRYNSTLCYNRATRTFKSITADKYPLLKLTFVFSMAADRHGNIWLAGDGLCRWNTAKQAIDTLIPYPTVQKALRNYMLILGHDANNNLWLSSFNNEIIQFNCETMQMYLREQDNNWMDGNTLTSSPIIHNNIWLGTDNGISAFDINTHAVRQFTHANGLSSVAITTYRRRSFYDSVANQFYIGAGHHLISFTPDVLHVAEVSPKLLIDQVLTRSWILPVRKDGIKVNYNENDITIVFNALNFVDPEESRFAWRMPHDPDEPWQELDQQNRINLTRLPPGHHPIEIKLYSVNNHWPAQIEHLDFYIQPPFWQTAWFMIAVLVAIGAIIYFFVRWRINEVRKKERAHTQVEQLKAEEYRSRLQLEKTNEQLAEAQLLALQTQMNPHFIFNALNSIKRMILDGENANGSRYLSKFAFMIRLTLEHSKKPFVTLQETIEYLVIYLEMEQLRFGDSFSYGIQTDPNLDGYETLIPSMMIQPLVENAIWHGLMPRQGKGKISIDFLQEGNEVVCRIKDNGIGIREAEKQKQLYNPVHRSVGLDNLRNRMKIMEEKYKMNFSFLITDIREQTGADSGTDVMLAFNSHH